MTSHTKREFDDSQKEDIQPPVDHQLPHDVGGDPQQTLVAKNREEAQKAWQGVWENSWD